METVLQLWIPGEPVPQGSMTPYKRGRVLGVKPANEKRLKRWRNRVCFVASRAWCEQAPVDEPVVVHATFYFTRPKDQHYSGRNAAKLKPWALTHPTSRGNGDVDKLARALLDGLDEAGVFTDDCRVRKLVAAKEWCGPLEEEGVMIAVSIDETPRCSHCGTSEAEWRHLRSRSNDPRSCCSASSFDGTTMNMTIEEA